MYKNFHDFYRGEIYYAHLNPSFGHEQGGTRLVLILQNDVGNYFSPTVIVTAISRSSRKKPSQPTHVLLDGIERLAYENGNNRQIINELRRDSNTNIYCR